MRINRIPQALRKKNMQELVDEHAEKMRPKPKPAAAVPVAAAAPVVEGRRSLKRSR
jgi:ribosomal protein L12E/L44/L45/RPP1/RPP2